MEKEERSFFKIDFNNVNNVNSCVKKNIELCLPDGISFKNFDKKDGVVIDVPSEVRASLHSQVRIDKFFLTMLADKFKAGSISNFFNNWKDLISDVNILGIVKYGLTLRFSNPPAPNAPFRYKHNQANSKLINAEIAALLKKGAIRPSAVLVIIFLLFLLG